MMEFKLTNPDKKLYPSGITKLDIVEFYQKIQEWVLPYITNRPLSLLRCPDGINSCFFQKHIKQTENLKNILYSIEIQDKSSVDDYIYIKDIKGLLMIVQMGVLEIHPWGSRVDNVDKPDMIIFDLDPGLGITWANIIKAAFVVKEELESLGLESFLKLSGGKGLHLVLPIMRRYAWEEVIHFAKTFAHYMSKKYPTVFIDVMTKSKRRGKIFLDYLRNHRGSTAIAPYSTRARENAPVAVPIAWDELKPKIKPDQYNIENLPKRLSKIKNDPWEDFLSTRQKLPKFDG